MTQAATSYFKIRSGQYVSHCFGVWIERWWWALVIPLSVFIIGGLYDTLWFIGGLALILIVYPAILALLYFNYALRPAAAYALLPHKISISPDNIIIEYEPQEGVRTPPTQTIPLREITDATDSGHTLILQQGSNRYDVIIIPLSTFAPEDIPKAIEIIKKNMPEKPTA